MPSGFGAKYRDLLHRAGLTAQRFAEVYSQPIVLRPTRFLGYGGRGLGAARRAGHLTKAPTRAQAGGVHLLDGR